MSCDLGNNDGYFDCIKIVIQITYNNSEGSFTTDFRTLMYSFFYKFVKWIISNHIADGSMIRISVLL